MLGAGSPSEGDDHLPWGMSPNLAPLPAGTSKVLGSWCKSVMVGLRRSTVLRVRPLERGVVGVACADLRGVFVVGVALLVEASPSPSPASLALALALLACSEVTAVGVDAMEGLAEEAVAAVTGVAAWDFAGPGMVFGGVMAPRAGTDAVSPTLAEVAGAGLGGDCMPRPD